MMCAWLLDLGSALIAALFLRIFVLSIVRIRGKSMLTALEDKDVVLALRLPYCFRRPRRGEIVICHYPGRRMQRCPMLPQAFVKRVIGLPGESLEIIEGIVHINGIPLDEPYLDPEMCRFLRSRPAIQLSKDEYFVMGDHRDRSNDSRSVGPIRRRAIRGHAVCILWPIRRAGKTR